MTTRAPYKKRLQQHLRETKAHAKAVERRLKKLGGDGSSLGTAVGKAMAVPRLLHAMRGSGEQEKMLKNAKTEYFNEHEEIATYLAIETLAEKVGDRETAKLARGIRRDEERMARFLEGQIKSLTKAVAVDEVPSEQRATRRRSRSAVRRRSRGSSPRRVSAASA
jgi:ferritin-like metal-binding protein YciE